MNKIAHNLAKIAQEMYSSGNKELAKDLFFTAIRLAYKENPLMDVLGDMGFKPSEVFEYGDDDKMDEVHPSDNSVHKDSESGVQEIWMHVNPDTGKSQYGYMHDGGEYGHKHAYYDNIEDLVAHIAEEDEESGHQCHTGAPCMCGGQCKCSSSSIFRQAKSDNKGKALNKPFRTPGGPKKFSVYVKNEKGNIIKVNFGDPNMSIKRDNPERRKNFRARHNCDNAGPKTKAKYWSCKMWSKPSVSKILKGK